MIFRTVFSLVIAFALATSALAADVKPPKRDATPTTEKHAALVKDGTALHDQGLYDLAAAKYEAVLAEAPDDALALYELAFTLFTKGDFKRALEIATRGAELRSDHLGRFYDLMGSSIDNLGKPEDAVGIYKSGLKVLPQDGLLHLNLAITYLRLKKPVEARKSLKLAAACDPDRPTPHYALAVTYFNDGYKVPALLSAARFLTLEPASERSKNALKIVSEVLQGGVTEGGKPNEININISPDSKTDEGDFMTAELALGITKAAGQTEESKGKSEAQLLVDQVDGLFAILSELGPGKDKSAFVHAYYMPYFAEMKKRGLVEPFVYYTFQKSDVPGVADWLRAHDDKVKEFLAWSKSYAWSRPGLK